MQSEGPDGQMGAIRSLVMALPVNLWRRDILKQWGATIQIPDHIYSPASQKMMQKMGY